jgi:membrane protease YdiL (CAAX protease family)
VLLQLVFLAFFGELCRRQGLFGEWHPIPRQPRYTGYRLSLAVFLLAYLFAKAFVPVLFLSWTYGWEGPWVASFKLFAVLWIEAGIVLACLCLAQRRFIVQLFHPVDPFTETAWRLGFPQTVSFALFAYFLANFVGTLTHLIVMGNDFSAEGEQVAVALLRGAELNPLSVLFTWLALAVAVPFMEELFFRGLCFGALRGYLSFWPAAALSGGIFALAHYASDQGLRNIEIFLALFSFSLLAAYAYERSRSLWVPVGMHGLFNLLSSTAIMLEWV